MKISPILSFNIGVNSPVAYKKNNSFLDNISTDSIAFGNCAPNIAFRGMWIWSDSMSRAQVSKIAEDFLLPELHGKKINSLCDLGCGEGGPTKFLSDTFNIPVQNVVGVDDIPSNSFPLGQAQFEYEDYRDYLNATDKKFDMISLCRPDTFGYEGEDVEELLTSVGKCLAEGGYFFTYGENYLMDEITDACKAKGIKYKTKEYDWKNMKRDVLDDRNYNLQAVLIPKSEL